MCIKAVISKVLVKVIRLLHQLDNKITHLAHNPNPSHFDDLTPVIFADENDVYSNALQWALRNESVKNIAITGPYGSGKSSVLRTFEINNKGYSYLNITLGTFDKKKPEKILIEKSILEQVGSRCQGSRCQA